MGHTCYYFPDESIPDFNFSIDKIVFRKKNQQQNKDHCSIGLIHRILFGANNVLGLEERLQQRPTLFLIYHCTNNDC